MRIIESKRWHAMLEAGANRHSDARFTTISSPVGRGLAIRQCKMVELVLLVYITLAVVVMNRARQHFRGLAARAVLAAITIVMIFAAAWLYGAYKARHAQEPTFSIDFIDG